MAEKSVKPNTKNVFNKVASITLFFWLIKILSTTVGEASADFFGNTLGVISVLPVFLLPAYAVGIV